VTAGDDNHLFDVAVHEAAHFVIANMFGLLNGEVTIKPTETARGLAICYPYFLWPNRQRRPNSKSIARARILVYMAGPVAAYIMRDVNIADDRNGSDIEEISVLAKDANIEHEVKRLETYAFQLVVRHWKMIERLAIALCRQKTLSEHRARHLIKCSDEEWRALRRKFRELRKENWARLCGAGRSLLYVGRMLISIAASSGCSRAWSRPRPDFVLRIRRAAKADQSLFQHSLSKSFAD